MEGRIGGDGWKDAGGILAELFRETFGEFSNLYVASGIELPLFVVFKTFAEEKNKSGFLLCPLEIMLGCHG
jgi:hypothetical protein